MHLIIETPLEFSVTISESRWHLITTVKHPIMLGSEEMIANLLQNPDEIRRSRQDSKVYLFYQQFIKDRWLCAVVKRHERDGFLITAYPTDAIKVGELLWKK